MQLNVSQQMKMSQQMKLAPRMIQSMEILQLSVMALNERIENELSENVVLEASSSESEDSTETEIELEIEKAREEASDTSVEEKELVVDSEGSNEADFERLLEMSADWSEDNVSAGSRVSSNRIEDDSNRKHDAMANMVSRPQSLHEYLLEQFAFFECRPEVRAFAEYLIQNLDGNGRLRSSLPEMSEVYGVPVSPDDAEEALSLIRMLDPPGVGARNDRECLLLQVTPETPHRDVLVTLISSHLEDVGENRLPVIQRKTGYSIDIIKEAIEYLTQHLDPYPGRGFEQRHVQNVTPDVAVEQNGNGKYVIRLLDAPIENQPLLSRPITQRPRPTDKRVHQEKNRSGTVVDRVGRTTIQHAETGRTVNRRLPNRVSRQRPRSNRAAENAAGRRCGGRACHHRLASR
jgi:RNA polymerase sigma-54 factor